MLLQLLSNMMPIRNKVSYQINQSSRLTKDLVFYMSSMQVIFVPFFFLWFICRILSDKKPFEYEFGKDDCKRLTPRVEASFEHV